jgi:hypothetical protein
MTAEQLFDFSRFKGDEMFSPVDNLLDRDETITENDEDISDVHEFQVAGE